MSAAEPPRILAAADFGPASATAVALAGAVAQALRARLVVMHVEALDVPPYFTSAQVDALQRERHRARAAAAAYLREFAGAHTAAPFEARVVDGPVLEAVLDAAGDADLLVLGTHGRRGPRRWWLGSAAEGVVAATHTPALITCALAPDVLGQHVERMTTLTPAGDVSWIEALGRMIDATIRTGDRDAVVQALRTCGQPLLFVPEAPGGAQGRLT